MESTIVYWIPILELLRRTGIAVLLVKARDAKHVPGRKDRCQRCAVAERLHSFGLLRARFPQRGHHCGAASLSASTRASDGGTPASQIQAICRSIDRMNIRSTMCRRHHGATGLGIFARSAANANPERWRACAITVPPSAGDREGASPGATRTSICCPRSGTRPVRRLSRKASAATFRIDAVMKELSIIGVVIMDQRRRPRGVAKTEPIRRNLWLSTSARRCSGCRKDVTTIDGSVRTSP